MGEEPEFSSPPKQTKPKAPMRFSFYNKVKPIPENDNNALTTEFSAEILQQEPPSEQRSKKFGGKLGRKKRLKSAPPERLKQTGSEELVPEVSPGVSQVSIADSGFVPEDSRSPSGSGPRDTSNFSGRGSSTRIAHSHEQSIGSGKMEELQSQASTMLSKLSEAQMEWSRMEEELLQLRAENEQLHFEHVQLKANYKQTEEDSASSKEKFVEAQTAVQSLRQENTSLKTALESVQSSHSKFTRDVKEIYDVLTATVTEYYNISPNEVKSRLESLSKLLQDLVEREQGLQNGKEDSSLKEDDVCVSVEPSALINDTSSQTRRDLPRVSSALRNANGVKNGCIATSSGYLRLDDEVGEGPPIDEIHDTVWLPDNQQSSPTSHKERKAPSNWNDSDAEYETSKEYNSLQSLFGLFCEQLNPNGIVAHAFAKGIIRQNEFDEVEAARTQLDKNKIFLSAVIKCDPERIKGFCQLLLRNGERRSGLILLNEFKRQGVDVTTLDLPPVSPPVINHEHPQYCPVSKKLRKPFTSFKRTVRRVSKKMDDFNFTCQEVLQEFLRARGKEGIVKRESFKNCSNDAALDLLLDYTDPIDCELIDDLVEQMEDDGLDHEWGEYKKLLKEEVLKTLDQCEKGECRPLREGQIALGFQTKRQASQHTMDKILGMKGFLIDIVGLRDADFLGVGNSTVTLFFGVARTHLPFLVLWLSRYRSNLRAFSVSVAFVPGEFMYDVDMDQEFSYPKAYELGDRMPQSTEKSVEVASKEPHYDSHLEQNRVRMSRASFVSNESGFGEGALRTPGEAQTAWVMEMNRCMHNLKELVEKVPLPPPAATTEVELPPVPRAEWRTSKLHEICKRTKEYMDTCKDDKNGKYHYQQYKSLNILARESDELPAVDKQRHNQLKAAYSPLATSQTSSSTRVQPSAQGGKYVQKPAKKMPHQVAGLFLNRNKTNH